jgi:hypothetical protein
MRRLKRIIITETDNDDVVVVFERLTGSTWEPVPDGDRRPGEFKHLLHMVRREEVRHGRKNRDNPRGR